jgi:hypothetical protein
MTRRTDAEAVERAADRLKAVYRVMTAELARAGAGAEPDEIIGALLMVALDVAYRADLDPGDFIGLVLRTVKFHAEAGPPPPERFQ